MFKSTSLNSKFCEIFKEVHSRIDLAVAEMELGKKLINKGLYKTEIAYKMAQSIESDNTIVIDQNDESIRYLVDAIKYVCND